MIKIISSDIHEFINFLNTKFPTNKDVFLHIVENCDTVEDPITGEQGYGVFVTSKDDLYNHIYVVGMDENTPLECSDICWLIAHEFKHFIQKYMEDDDFSEDGADSFAYKMIKEFENRKQQ